MRSRKHTFPTTVSRHRVLICAIFVAIALHAPLGSAQQPLEPTWRQGVSRWNGNGYLMPPNLGATGASATSSSATSSSATNSSATNFDAVPPGYVPLPPTTSVTSSISTQSSPQAPLISDAPYTIPVDPSEPASGLEIKQRSVGPQINPYAQLPASDTATALESTSPSDRPGDISGDTTHAHHTIMIAIAGNDFEYLQDGLSIFPRPHPHCIVPDEMTGQTKPQ